MLDYYTVDTDYKQFNKARPEEIVEAMYDISQLREDEKALLSVFSVLPTENILYEHLEILLPTFEYLDKICLSTAQKGWIEPDQNASSYKCNPIVQEIVRKQNRDLLLEHTQDLFNSLVCNLEYEINTGNLTEVEYDIGVIFAQYAETVCHYLYPLRGDITLLQERLGSFFQHYDNLDKALKYFEEFMRLIKEFYDSNPQNVSFKNGLAISYERLGSTHTSLGNLDKALKYFEEHTSLLKELYDSNPQNVGFKNSLTISYERLGSTHTFFGNFDKALEYFEDETVLFEELYDSNPQNVDFKYGLAASYERLGATHTSLGNLDKALKYFEDRSRLGKELYDSNPQNVGFKNGLAISYSKLGESHTSLGNLDKALKYFEEFMRLIKELCDSNPQNVSFKNGLAISYFKLGETHTSLGNLDKALKYFEDETVLFEELYELNPQNVGFKNGLAISYSRLGVFKRDKKNDKKTARLLFLKAQKLWKDLYSQFTAYAEYQKSLEWVNRAIDDL